MRQASPVPHTNDACRLAQPLADLRPSIFGLLRLSTINSQLVQVRGRRLVTS